MGRLVMPSLFTLNPEAVRQPALETIHQILTTPTDEDQLRRERGQQFVEHSRKLRFGFGAAFPYATSQLPEKD